jgi:hypothetical protein
MVKSPLPSVSDAASRYDPLIPVLCIGKMDLLFGVFLDVSSEKSSFSPNGTG